MRNTNKAVINFCYFGHNYPYNFIDLVWKDDNHIAKHLQDKFNQMYPRHTTMTFFLWFMELDDYNKEKLVDWIEYNYLAFKHLRTNERQPELK